MCACKAFCVPELSEETLRGYIARVEENSGLVLKEKECEAVCHFCRGNDVLFCCHRLWKIGYIRNSAICIRWYNRLAVAFHSWELCLYIYAAGKSGCIVLCISPLTAIMIEQRKKFTAKGIKTEFVGEAQIDNSAKDRVVNGQVQLLYISPENLLYNSRYWNMLSSPVYKKTYLCFCWQGSLCADLVSNWFVIYNHKYITFIDGKDFV